MGKLDLNAVVYRDRIKKRLDSAKVSRVLLSLSGLNLDFLKVEKIPKPRCLRYFFDAWHFCPLFCASAERRGFSV